MRACRDCGCTYSTPCMDSKLGPCWWVEDDLCSHCQVRGYHRRTMIRLVASYVIMGLVMFFAGEAYWSLHHGGF